jgi:hypothetical protein
MLGGQADTISGERPRNESHSDGPPSRALRDAVLTHPTVFEGVVGLSSSVPAKSQPAMRINPAD